MSSSSKRQFGGTLGFVRLADLVGGAHMDYVNYQSGCVGAMSTPMTCRSKEDATCR